jgi:hypothetical protein
LALLLGSAAPAAAMRAAQSAAQSAMMSAEPAALDRLDAECARLRGELGRVNAEITSLKRGDRGVRDDYRLRKRMADAEELARKLTAAEAEVRRLRAPIVPGTSTPTATPVPARTQAQAPAEAPGVLEARADLLTDEARRLTLRASTLERAADQLRDRQSLRRRAGHLERDPFAAMEGSKRFMVVPGAPLRTSAPPGRQGTDATAGAPTPPPTPPPEMAPPPPTGTAPPSTVSAPGASPGSSTPAPPSVASPAPAPPTTPQPAQPAGAERAGGPAVADGKGNVPAGFLSAPTTTVAGSRALLDPDTAAELRRLEAGGAAANGRPLNEVERLQQAAAILSRKAQTLESQARALRARAAQR